MRLNYSPRYAIADRWYRRRYLLLFVYLSGIAVIAVGATCFDDLLLGSLPVGWLIGWLALIAAAQGLFLCGAPQLRWPRPTGRRPMAVSLIVASLMSALLTTGLVAAFISLFRLNATGDDIARRLVAWMDQSSGERLPAVIYLGIGLSWGIWLFVFGVVWAGESVTRFRRIYRLLVAGTVLELLITIPIDVQVRRRTSCYCGEGTFLALIIGLTSAVWVFGPGIALLFLTRRLHAPRRASSVPPVRVQPRRPRPNAML